MAKGELAGRLTNNQAEYLALVRGLRQARKCLLDPGRSTLEVRSDSRVLVGQMKKEYGTKNANLIDLAAEAHRLVAGFAVVTFLHLPRWANARADALCDEALDGS
mgnify:FL=1